MSSQPTSVPNRQIISISSCTVVQWQLSCGMGVVRAQRLGSKLATGRLQSSQDCQRAAVGPLSSQPSMRARIGLNCASLLCRLG